jgi:hypothetical protein
VNFPGRRPRRPRLVIRRGRHCFATSRETPRAWRNVSGRRASLLGLGACHSLKKVKHGSGTRDCRSVSDPHVRDGAFVMHGELERALANPAAAQMISNITQATNNLSIFCCIVRPARTSAERNQTERGFGRPRLNAATHANAVHPNRAPNAVRTPYHRCASRSNTPCAPEPPAADHRISGSMSDEHRSHESA